MYKDGKTDASFLPLESVVEGQVCSSSPHLASMNAAICCISLQEAQSCVKGAAVCPVHFPRGLHCFLDTYLQGRNPKQEPLPSTAKCRQCCCQPPQSEVWKILVENLFRNTTLIMLMKTSLGF